MEELSSKALSRVFHSFVFGERLHGPSFRTLPYLFIFPFFTLSKKKEESHRKQISFKDHSLPLGKREKEWVSDSFELGRGKTFADSPRSIFLFFFPFYPARGSGAQFPQVP